MIITQTPLRISLFGGGTDLPKYADRYWGLVVTTTIDKYIYVIAKRRFDDLVRVGYTQTEMVADVHDLKHELIREALKKAHIYSGVEITTMADIPSEGTGLGSSSAVTVGALNALHALQNRLRTAEQLASQACNIEIGKLHKPIGRQDQYAVAYGGLRVIDFQHHKAKVQRHFAVRPEIMDQLERSLMLYYTGRTRQAGDVLHTVEYDFHVLDNIKSNARAAIACLLAGDLQNLGSLFHASWELKKQLSPHVTNPDIDEMYQLARSAGAQGGKITGAGGGGFMLLYVDPERQDYLRQRMGNYKELPFRFSHRGSQVIFSN